MTLTDRDRKIMLALVPVLVLVAYWFLLLAPKREEAGKASDELSTQQTRVDNARFFDGDIDKVPTHCITQGLGTILRARHLVLLAFGKGKAEAVAGAVEGPVTASLPASAIQLHPHATVVIDDAAASDLRFGEYYRYTFANKPDWQGL